MSQDDTNRQGTVDTTREVNRPRTKPQQRPPSDNPGGGEPDVRETQRDRTGSTGASRGDVERGGAGGDLPM